MCAVSCFAAEATVRWLSKAWRAWVLSLAYARADVAGCGDYARGVISDVLFKIMEHGLDQTEMVVCCERNVGCGSVLDHGASCVVNEHVGGG